VFLEISAVAYERYGGQAGLGASQAMRVVMAAAFIFKQPAQMSGRWVLYTRKKAKNKPFFHCGQASSR
jgi:hypothetical protein